jgi:hypothetical protein
MRYAVLIEKTATGQVRRLWARFMAPRHTTPLGDAPRALIVVVFNGYGFEVFGFEDLAAVQAFQVFHAIASGDDLCTVVLASVRLHKARLRIYSNEPDTLVKGAAHYFFRS